MFTNNFKKLVPCMIISTTYPSSSLVSECLIDVVCTDGVTRKACARKSTSENASFPTQTASLPLTALITTDTTTSNRGIVFGSGTGQPDRDDYVLENPITNLGNTGLKATMLITKSSVDSNGVYSSTTTYAVTNNSDSSVTISEIGWVEAFGVKLSATTMNKRQILFDRTLLDEPVTIEAGGVANIEYTLSYDLN